MEREIDLAQISDGRRYGLNDLVKADCAGCQGCFSCCCGMEDTILLDPYDMYRMAGGLQKTFDQLLEEQKIELNLSGGMDSSQSENGSDSGRCVFLNGTGRCSIHKIRPGICRIFPLGRVYEEGKLSISFQFTSAANRARKDKGEKMD